MPYVMVKYLNNNDNSKFRNQHFHFPAMINKQQLLENLKSFIFAHFACMDLTQKFLFQTLGCELNV